jgi:hypothetical protein
MKYSMLLSMFISINSAIVCAHSPQSTPNSQLQSALQEPAVQLGGAAVATVCTVSLLTNPTSRPVTKLLGIGAGTLVATNSVENFMNNAGKVYDEYKGKLVKSQFYQDVKKATKSGLRSMGNFLIDCSK